MPTFGHRRRPLHQTNKQGGGGGTNLRNCSMAWEHDMTFETIPATERKIDIDQEGKKVSWLTCICNEDCSYRCAHSKV